MSIKNPNSAKTDAERRAQNKWEQANRVTLGVRLSKADGEAFRAWCAARGMTVNAALSSYVADCLRGSASPDQAAPENSPASQKTGAAEAPKIPAEDSGA